MSFRRGNLGFFVVEGLFWAAYCTLFGFTVTILRAYGFSAQLCGVVTTAQCILLMLAQPVYGYIIDHIISPKRGFICIMAAGMVFSLPLPWIFGLPVWFSAGYMSFLALFVYSGGLVVDAWAVAVINRTPGMDYAVCRGGGSMLYALVALLAGNLIAPFGVQSLFVLHAVICLLAVLVAMLLVDSTKLEDGNKPVSMRSQQLGFLKASRLLLANRAYLLFTVCMCLFNFATRPYGTYMALVLENVGGDSSHLGMSLFISAFGELLVMLVASRLLIRGMSPIYLYFMASVILAFRIYIMALSDSLWVIVLTQVIQAVGFGLNLRMNSEYLVSTAPPGCEGMSLMLSGSISTCFGSVMGNFLGGYLIDLFGVQAYTFICACIMLLVPVIFMPTVLREHRKRREQHIGFLMRQNSITSVNEET